MSDKMVMIYENQHVKASAIHETVLLTNEQVIVVTLTDGKDYEIDPYFGEDEVTYENKMAWLDQRYRSLLNDINRAVGND
jgi:hypothetical protein